jgi:metal-responsive CopG/Arc/MetJ family transcriptional regulator
MANKVRVTFTIDKELNEQWNRVSEKLKINKSAMLREMLEEILPVLDKEEPREIIRAVINKSLDNHKEMSNGLLDFIEEKAQNE